MDFLSIGFTDLLMKSYVVLWSSSEANNSTTDALLIKSNNECL